MYVMDSAILKGLPGQIIRAIGPHTEAHPMALLSQLLASYGAMVGPGPYFSTEADCHQTNLFVLNVGNSSKGRKGTSWGQIRRLIEMADPDWLEHSMVNGFGSGEALTWRLSQADLPPLAFPPPARQTTKNILIMESEFGSFLKVVNKEGNTTSPVMRNAWDGVTLRNITKGSDLRVSGHHVSAIGHITKTELLQLLRQTEVMNGLANRFLFFFVERSKCLPFGSEVPIEDLKLMSSELKQSVEFGRSQGLMKRSEAANSLWAQVYPELSEGLPGIVGSLSSRSEAQIMRLAMVQSLFNRHKKIELEDLKSAIDIHKYCLGTLRFVFGNKTGMPLADRIYDFILDSEAGVSKTDIRDFLNRNSNKEVVNDALNLLLESKQITTVSVSKGGRKICMYVVCKDEDGIQDDFDDIRSTYRNQGSPLSDMSLMSSDAESV